MKRVLLVKRLTLRFFAGILLLTVSQAQAGDLHFYYDLASYHAPVLFQKVGTHPKADAITRFDFDGDERADNNWQNLSRYPTPAYVYYDVKETATHYFISYGLFHPRDYLWLCIPLGCHENDLEGILLTIQKDESSFGKLHTVQTLAHSKIRTYTNFSYRNSARPSSESPARVSLYVEAEGHGIFGFNPMTGRKLKEDSENDYFSESQILSQATHHYTHKWFVYHFGGTAEDPGSLDSGIFKYDLLPIWNHFWQNRESVGDGKMFRGQFTHEGARFSLGILPESLAGKKWCRGCVSPPWGWHDVKVGSKRGDWFFDPAWEVLFRLGQEPNERYSLDYLFNPYLDFSLQSDPQ